MKLDYEYFPIPKQLLSCKSVNGFKWNGDAKNLYFKMDKETKFYTEKYGYYEPSNEALAYSMGITEKTVRNIIGRLEDAELCVCTNKGVKGVKLKYKVTHWKNVPEITAMPSDREERIRKGGSSSFEDYHEEPESDMTLVDTGKPVTAEKPPEAPQEPEQVQDEQHSLK
ncbi:TPA: hypothetical protein NPO55_004285 [Klebsiella pneumoniae]|nr:hypothetical protein [Klebsiella pneumoniae]